MDLANFTRPNATVPNGIVAVSTGFVNSMNTLYILHFSTYF